MTRLAFVGESLTITGDAVVLDLPALTDKDAGRRRDISFDSIDEVSVFEHGIGDRTRLVVASPDTVLAKDYAEAWMARQACRILTHAMNTKGAYTRAQKMRGEPLED